MTTNGCLPRLLLAIVLFLGLAPFLCAQSAEARYRLVWTGGEHALRYEVVVEKEIDGNYITHLREFTEMSFIEVSLPPGHYRLQVISYDILDRPEDVSKWINIEVRPAVQPELVSDDSNQEDRSNSLKQRLLLGSAAWVPVLPIHGDFFGSGFSAAGFGIRFGAAFPVPGDIHIGAELTALWHANNANEDNAGFGNVLSAGANLLAMKWLPNQVTALNFRLGASYIFFPETQEKSVLSMGASYLWRFTGEFLLEIGFDYASLIKENSFDGCIRPWIGVGITF